MLGIISHIKYRGNSLELVTSHERKQEGPSEKVIDYKTCLLLTEFNPILTDLNSVIKKHCLYCIVMPAERSVKALYRTDLMRFCRLPVAPSRKINSIVVLLNAMVDVICVRILWSLVTPSNAWLQEKHSRLMVALIVISKM